MSDPIQRVVIGTHRGDYWLARLCIASIRHWEPDCPITLLKDVTYSNFDTSDAERHWGVTSACVRGYGNPSAKLEVLFFPAERIFFVDADTVFLGSLCRHFSEIDADVVVSPSRIEDPATAHVDDYYYNFPQLRAFDPLFRYPGYVFNTGQFVVRAGLLQRADVAPFFTQQTGRNHVRHPHVFRHNEQGVLSYLLPKLAQDGRITIATDNFKLFAHPSVIGQLDFAEILRCGGSPKMIHWAGKKPHELGAFLRADILQYYQAKYYERLPQGNNRLRHDAREARRFGKFVGLAKAVYARLPQAPRLLAKRLLNRAQ